MRCPNLRIGPPSGNLREHGGGRALLRATSDVRSRGLGPIELHGRRDGLHRMSVRQRIYRKGAGHLDVPPTRASLHFTNSAPTSAAATGRSTSWPTSSSGPSTVTTACCAASAAAQAQLLPGDIERTRAGKRSPELRHYPACNQNPYEDRVTLGTSVGWSDIYPANYDKQWIPVGGLRGCFAFVMTVDPYGLLFESDENDNTSRRLVHLPYRGNAGC